MGRPLSEVLANLDLDERVEFSLEPMFVRIVAKKGPMQAAHKEVSISVSLEAIESIYFDVLARETDRAFQILRQDRMNNSNEGED